MARSLPLLQVSPPSPPLRDTAELAAELQTYGMRWLDPEGYGLSRKGGAGPSDHKAVSLGGHTLMVPILNHASALSPYAAKVSRGGERASLLRRGEWVAEITFPRQPKFYLRVTEEGVPYWKIATLHAADVLATTVLQTCTRYGNRRTSCQFCAIGQSLAAKSTIPEKRPEQLAEVAEAAVELDGVRHLVMTTGTPATDDRGAAVLAECARAVKGRVALPVQAQCEPPADFGWFRRLADAGVDALGLHLEAVSEPVRRRIMPGKAEVPVAVYFEAFERAVEVFGRGQVSTYILAGLGDTEEQIVDACERLVALGVYPFVVPFVPIAGTPLEHHEPPPPLFMDRLLARVASVIAQGGLRTSEIKAGCARCGACSSLKVREEVARA
jgi:radical SAM protein (TIGR04043 family)